MESINEYKQGVLQRIDALAEAYSHAQKGTFAHTKMVAAICEEFLWLFDKYDEERDDEEVNDFNFDSFYDWLSNEHERLAEQFDEEIRIHGDKRIWWGHTPDMFYVD